MRLYNTEIRAIDPATGELRTFAGPAVQGFTAKHAQAWCNQNELGYCKVLGLISVLIMEDGTEVDIEKVRLN